MTIDSIHHVSINAPPEVIDATRDFYIEVLGLEEGFRPDFGIPGHWLYQGDHPMIHLIALGNGNDDATRNNGYFDHFAFRCSDLGAVMAKLDTRDIHYSRADNEELQQTQLFVTDPAGITVELNFFGETAND